MHNIKITIYSLQVFLLALLISFNRYLYRVTAKIGFAAYRYTIGRMPRIDYMKDIKMLDFTSLGLPKSILCALENINFTNPTPIQEQAIPVALEGHDIIGSAQTGTGKTAAFAIPMINHLLKNDASAALILLPTRELAQQVLDSVYKMLGGNSKKIKTALLIGGEHISKQLQQLRHDPRIIVGTPGRINDHLVRKSLDLSYTDFLVLDETDRMLDMGFGVQLDQILKFVPKERQTLMFSATMPANIVNLSRKYLKQPVRISVGDANRVADNIKQEIIKTNDAKKYGDLMIQLKNTDGSTLIFVKTKFGAERLAKKLTIENQPSIAIHGDLQQRQRERVIDNFRKQKSRILVATDIAARGLDIPHIQFVINYDLPQCPEDYIHRIGRTARAGMSGCAVNLITAKDSSKWKEIYKIMNPTKRDKAVLSDNDYPIEAMPLNAKSKPTKIKNFEQMGELSVGGRKPKAKMSSANPFNPFAPADRKKKFRTKFNKNSRSYGDMIAAPIELGGAKKAPRKRF